MKFKKEWKDRQGVAPITIIAVLAVIAALVAVGYAVMVAYPDLIGDDTVTETDFDVDGDGVEDPIIGYLSIKVDVFMWSNGPAFGWDADLKNLKCSIVNNKPSGGEEPKEFGIGSYDETMTLKFTISAPPSLNVFVNERVIKQAVSSLIPGSSSTSTVSPDITIQMRYHPTVHVLVELFDGDGTSGKLLDTIEGDFKV